MKQKICTEEDCSYKHYAKGLCQQHYAQRYHQENQEEDNERNRHYYEANKEEILARQDSVRKKEYNKVYYRENKEKLAERQRQWRLNNRDKVLAAKAKYRKNNGEKLSWLQKERYKRQRQRDNQTIYSAFIIYGCECQSCKQKDIVVLQWHHRNGNRKTHKESNIDVSKRVVKENKKVDDIMLLCANCHTHQDLADGTSKKASRLQEIAELWGS